MRVTKRWCWVTAALALFIQSTAAAQMKAHVINVGQAESILLEFSDAAVLIDAGGEDTGTTRDRDHLLGYLDSFFARRPDLDRTLRSVIVSHPHIDHTRLLMDVMRRYHVINLIDGGGRVGSGIQQVLDARRYAEEHDIIYNVVPESRIGARGYQPRMLRGLRTSKSEVDIRFVGGTIAGCQDQNNNSLVTLVTYREASFLFTGDAEDEDEKCTPSIQRMLARPHGPLLDVDVYKVGHHGSRNGSSAALLQRMSPEVAVISAGNRETRSPGRFHAWFHGHPRESVVGMLEQATSGTRNPPLTAYTMVGQENPLENRRISKAVYCTCWDGDLVISTDASGSRITVDANRR